MKRRNTFDAITRVLEDGSWHELEDLRKATSFPSEWVEELEAEGIVDTQDRIGNVLVRLRPQAPPA